VHRRGSLSLIQRYDLSPPAQSTLESQLIGNDRNGNATEKSVNGIVRDPAEGIDDATIILNQFRKELLNPVVGIADELFGMTTHHPESTQKI
jgi:hypothetical protein